MKTCFSLLPCYDDSLNEVQNILADATTPSSSLEFKTFKYHKISRNSTAFLKSHTIYGVPKKEEFRYDQPSLNFKNKALGATYSMNFVNSNELHVTS